MKESILARRRQRIPGPQQTAVHREALTSRSHGRRLPPLPCPQKPAPKEGCCGEATEKHNDRGAPATGYERAGPSCSHAERLGPPAPRANAPRARDASMGRLPSHVGGAPPGFLAASFLPHLASDRASFPTVSCPSRPERPTPRRRPGARRMASGINPVTLAQPDTSTYLRQRQGVSIARPRRVSTPVRWRPSDSSNGNSLNFIVSSNPVSDGLSCAAEGDGKVVSAQARSLKMIHEEHLSWRPLPQYYTLGRHSQT